MITIPPADTERMLTDLRRQLVERGAPSGLIEILDGPGTAEERLGQLAAVEHSIAGDVTSAMLDGWAELLEPGSEWMGIVRGPSEHIFEEVRLLTATIEDVERHGGPTALAMVRSLAVMGPEYMQPVAAAAGDRMVAGGLTDPMWVAGLGQPEFVTTHAHGDTEGTWQVVSPVFRYGPQPHAVSVVIDRGTSGGVENCWPSREVDAVRDEARRAEGDPLAWYREMDAAETHRVLAEALSRPRCPSGPEQVANLNLYLTLVEKRCARLGVILADR